MSQKAFPIACADGYNEGMDLRDYFAAQVAPTAIIIAMDLPNREASPCPNAARMAYEMADAMMAERKKCEAPANEQPKP